MLESAGKAYYEFRADLMVRNNEGLTKTYNRFHDPDERSPDILKLRELHAAMDRAVLDAYGWTDLKPHLRIPPRLRGGRRRGRDRQAAAARSLALPLARRLPRRGPRPPAGTEPPARRGRAPERRRRRVGRGKATKKSTGRRKAGTKNPDQAEFFETRRCPRPGKSPRRSPSSPPAAPVPAIAADRLLGDIRALIEAAREQTAQAVNSALVLLYWHIGKRIREDFSRRSGPSTARRLSRRCRDN